MSWWGEKKLVAIISYYSKNKIPLYLTDFFSISGENCELENVTTICQNESDSVIYEPNTNVLVVQPGVNYEPNTNVLVVQPGPTISRPIEEDNNKKGKNNNM